MASLRVVTFNVNGIRSAISKGFLDWLAQNPADILCLQEIKAQKDHVDGQALERLGYQSYWYSADKKGYSGVALFSRPSPDRVLYGNGFPQSDSEGRVIRMDLGDLTVVNAYFPSGSSGDLRQTYKYQWLEEFMGFLKDLRRERTNLLVCGDYNICHKAIDIHDPKGNRDSSGFLPEERAWMDRFFESGFLDTFRYFNPQPQQYSWWSFRANARNNNKGWRIDYINATANLKSRLKDARIHPEIRFSDHCPVSLTLG